MTRLIAAENIFGCVMALVGSRSLTSVYSSDLKTLLPTQTLIIGTKNISNNVEALS
jgi:hypothetical protein